ncbi:MazG-like protein [Flavobacterium sp. JLP]|uniref:MazG-like protein n=1 Tax=Flavobacterium sp. JLP TaxID=2783793 RepID=UPI00188D5FDF|nr:MazG-like protein [Flavobacterium sp. JLP]MBF4507752.1 MazG-like protein [Flavobacterium sp. JLP]
MPKIDFEQLKQRSVKIRDAYHKLELAHHGSQWTVEEDALAFLTDAGLVGRHAMSQQGRWPKENTKEELEHKLGESIWWLTVLAARMDLDIEEATEKFLSKTEKLLG